MFLNWRNILPCAAPFSTPQSLSLLSSRPHTGWWGSAPPSRTEVGTLESRLEFRASGGHFTNLEKSVFWKGAQGFKEWNSMHTHSRATRHQVPPTSMSSCPIRVSPCSVVIIHQRPSGLAAPNANARFAKILKQKCLRTRKRERPGSVPGKTCSLPINRDGREGFRAQVPPLKHTPAACLNPCHWQFLVCLFGRDATKLVSL